MTILTPSEVIENALFPDTIADAFEDDLNQYLSLPLTAYSFSQGNEITWKPDDLRPVSDLMYLWRIAAPILCQRMQAIGYDVRVGEYKATRPEECYPFLAIRKSE